MQDADATLRAALSHPLESIDLDGEGVLYRGKVRDNFSRPDKTRVLVTTDRISAFDRVLGTLPLKGQVLSTLAVWWFRRTAHIAPNHLIAAPDPNVVIAHECVPLPVEVVVRRYLTGVTSTSIWTAYARGERTFCGHALPDGLRKNDPLPEAIVTPSTKADKGGHDQSVSADALVASGVISRDDMDAVSRMALALFAFGAEHCARHGLILADTKYEFGRRPDGTIVVMDEMHTPDSSRFWFAGSYPSRLAAGEEPESFDKEYVRRWLAAQGFTGDGEVPALTDDVRVEASRRYIEAYERITGDGFVADLSPPLPRIRAALAGVHRAPLRGERSRRMRARVSVTLKREVLDPQGEAVRKGLHAMGVEGVREARVGKVIELVLDDVSDPAEALATVRRAADKLLANPVIEDYAVELIPDR